PGAPPAGPGQPGGPLPSEDPFLTQGPSNPDGAYQWAIGAELGGLANRTIGNADGNEQFAESGFSLRLFSNFIVNPEHMIGIQGYVAFSGLKPGADNVFDERL